LARFIEEYTKHNAKQTNKTITTIRITASGNRRGSHTTTPPIQISRSEVAPDLKTQISAGTGYIFLVP